MKDLGRPQVRVRRSLAATVYEAETCWFDTGAWPDWIEGLSRVVEVGPGWPSEGSHVVWESGPAGRGRVRERVLERSTLEGQTVEVEDATIRGWQRVSFDPTEDGIELTVSLSYALKRRSPIIALVNRLFIRKAFERSLRTTVERFAVEVANRRAASERRG